MGLTPREPETCLEHSALTTAHADSKMAESTFPASIDYPGSPHKFPSAMALPPQSIRHKKEMPPELHVNEETESNTVLKAISPLPVARHGDNGPAKGNGPVKGRRMVKKSCQKPAVWEEPAFLGVNQAHEPLKPKTKATDDKAFGNQFLLD